MKPSTYKCLKLLRDQESVTTHDFLVGGCGSRFGARLSELRHEHGCVIEEHKLSDRSGSRYRLVAEPETSPAANPPAPAGEKPAPRTDTSGQANAALPPVSRAGGAPSPSDGCLFDTAPYRDTSPYEEAA